MDKSVVISDAEYYAENTGSRRDESAIDALDMERMGKPQELRVRLISSAFWPPLTEDIQRNFTFFSIFGFSIILMSTWETQLGVGVFGLSNGGTAGMIYVYLGTWVGFAAITISMAEMASMAPTAGGQYHWVSEFAPPRSQKFLSYLIGKDLTDILKGPLKADSLLGWLCVLGWQAGTGSACFLAGTEIQGLIVLNHPDYIYQRWHGTLLTIAVIVFCGFFNTFLAKRLPLVEGLVLILHVLGFFAIMVPLWVFAPHAKASAVFTEFNDGGGWGNTGLSCLVGILAPVVSLLGSDAATHMSEELKNASKTLPWTMVSTVAFNGALGFVMVITFVFALGDLESVLATPTGYPFIQIFYNATLSKGGATAMTSIMIVLATFGGMTNMATASRQLFAFARDEGVPLSGFFSRVSLGWDIPLNAVITTTFIASAFSLINIGSTIAFNQITSLGLCALLSSYLVSISCIALKRIRKEPLLNSYFTLGRYGLAINIVSILFLVLAYIMIFFPPTTNPIPSGMNWSVVIYAGVLGVSFIYFFFKGRHVYVGPVEYVKKDM